MLWKRLSTPEGFGAVFREDFASVVENASHLLRELVV